ncbi:MAG TPA: formyltetrahydrofolate deformylase [Corynebacteriales bacterium]|nr:formyltetrahydrofolate deformylase [Mycobacteriales bacterium]
MTSYLKSAGNNAGDERRYVFTLACPDRVGIVADISQFLADLGGWIVEANYYADPVSNWFHTRQAVRADSVDMDFADLQKAWAEFAQQLGPDAKWRVTDTAQQKRGVIMVSKQGHCLHDLLGRIYHGDYPMQVECVISNHPDLESMAQHYGIPYHHVPFAPGEQGKREAFDKIAELVDDVDPDVIVLARFMQILPPDLCERWAGRCINIHHSFLPSFIGARPYAQAYTRGVKLVGATCHFVTSDLDNGPIIEQDVQRVTHADTEDEMVRRGRDIEELVMARGLRFFLEDRVQVHNHRTVIFTQ